MLQGISRHHWRCSRVIPDAPRSMFLMFMKIDFSKIFPELTWRRMLRTPPLPLGGVPQVLPEASSIDVMNPVRAKHAFPPTKAV